MHYDNYNLHCVVALRKESVDRNCQGNKFRHGRNKSLSARRAWIEMIDYIIDYANDAVALRKESVDRNTGILTHNPRKIVSLSARRAWIEMAWVQEFPKLYQGRSPQGERG